MSAAAPSLTWNDFFADGRGARLALICLGVWLNAADSLVTSTIMPTVGRDLGGYAYFSWATAAYMVGAILSGATAARVSARFGLRRAMVAAGLVTAAGCAVSALAPGMIVLVAGRAVQGVGAGWIVGACYAAIGAMFPERHLARIFGAMTGVWGVATVVGPLVGAAFAEGGEWRLLFWAFAAQCFVFVAAAVWLLPEDAPPAGHRTAWRQLGLVLLGVGLIGAADLTSSVVLAGGLCVASLAVFVASVRLPAGEGGLFPRAAGDLTGTIGAAYLSYFALTAAGMCFSVYAPALLQKLYGLSPLVAGYAAGLEALGWTVAALGVAGLADKWHGRVIRLGVVCIVGALAALTLVMRWGPLWAILVAAFVMGAGFGFTSGFIGRRVIAAAEGDSERELASAGINSVRQIGNAAGACLAGIVANLLGLSAGIGFAAAQTTAIWLFALSVPVALLGAAGAWKVAGQRAAAT
ncbi:MAG TPA: MFS transporter [Caulobacteraceae bacterium]|jgi:MFS family permease